MRALGGDHITSACRTCLNAADHLRAVTSLAVEHRQLNLAAAGSLARGAIENGATAFWLIHPRSRDEGLSTRCSGGRRRLMINREQWAISAWEAPQPSRCSSVFDRVIAAALRVCQDRTLAPPNVQRFPNDTTRRRSGVMRNLSVIITACCHHRLPALMTASSVACVAENAGCVADYVALLCWAALGEMAGPCDHDKRSGCGVMILARVRPQAEPVINKEQDHQCQTSARGREDL